MMARGRIKVFFTGERPTRSGKSGFGFIEQNDGSDVFVHANQLIEVVKQVGGEENLKGTEVNFEVRTGRRGEHAANVRLAIFEEIAEAEDYWAPPVLAVVEELPVKRYYPLIDGAEAVGVKIERFDSLLVRKEGEEIVPHDGLDSHGAIERYWASEEPKAQLYGIIPPEAEDGFWFWSSETGGWEYCQEVEVHATSVSVRGGDAQPAYYRFVGLRTEKSGVLVPYPEFEGDIIAQEFFELRKLQLGEETSLPIVETPVRKKGWWSYEQQLEWLEPELVEGFAPKLKKVLARAEEAEIYCQRVDGGNRNLKRLVIEVPGEDACVLEYRPGHAGIGQADGGIWGPEMSSPALFVERADGCTYIASGKKHANEKEWGILMQLYQEAPLKAGPYEEKVFAECGGHFFIRRVRKSDKYMVSCPHGFKVAGTREESFAELFGRSWSTQPCRFGCEAQKSFMPEMVLVEDEEKFGLARGHHSVEDVVAAIEEKDPFWRFRKVEKASTTVGGGCFFQLEGPESWYATADVASGNIFKVLETVYQGEGDVRVENTESGVYIRKGKIENRGLMIRNNYEIEFRVSGNGSVEILRFSEEKEEMKTRREKRREARLTELAEEFACSVETLEKEFGDELEELL